MVRQLFTRPLGRMAAVLVVAGVVCAVARTGDPTPVKAGGQKKLDKVTVSATTAKPAADGAQKVTVVVEADEGWYAYANPVGLEGFEENRTEIKVGAKGKVEKFQVSYPPGKVKEDKVLGNYKIYEGKVAIPVLVYRAQGDTSPLEVTVMVSICSHKGLCLKRQDTRLILP
jgi:DsbC/DsbD-like thiol-disulfide interchange protein